MVVYRAVIKHQAYETISRLKTNGIEKTNLDEELPVIMNDETG